MELSFISDRRNDYMQKYLYTVLFASVVSSTSAPSFSGEFELPSSVLSLDPEGFPE